MHSKAVSGMFLVLLIVGMLSQSFLVPGVQATDIIVDTDGDSRFTKYPIGGAYWWSRSDSGTYNGNFWYTYCGDAAHGGDLYWGKWDPPYGQYEVSVWIPNPTTFPSYVPTHSANYDIYHSGGLTEIAVNQALRLGGWYSLGSYTFVSGSMINLDDRTGEPYVSTMVAFDAIKFTPIVTYRTLTVSSAHDSPVPGNGAHTYSDGQSVTCSVTSQVTEGNTVWTCAGWTGTGSVVPASGTGTSVTFTITQDSSITWNWIITPPDDNPPFTPSNPRPPDHSSGVLITKMLVWNGGDPDTDDIVTYDVHFGVSSPPPLVASDWYTDGYIPDTPPLGYATTYYWKIVSRDNHGRTTAGPVWDFTTETGSYDATITAHCSAEGADVSVAIAEDGLPTGYNTPHTFTGLTNTHTFAVPSTDANGHPFINWNTGQTTTSIPVTSDGIFTAYYQATPSANHPPNQPSNISPANGAPGVELRPTFRASDFYDPDPSDTHAFSQWQVTRTPGDYSNPVFDIVGDIYDGRLTQITFGIDLEPSTTYYWRVRYRDSGYPNPAWSNWSLETSFTTISGSSPDIAINAYCNTEGVPVSVPLTMDGASTGYNTPHTFTGLSGSHTFTVPSNDGNSHTFKQWSTGQTTTMITVSSGGTYTAYYQASTTPNSSPTLSSGSVTPSSGDTSKTFEYYVLYKDPDNDAPTTRQVFIDGSAHTMTKVSGDYLSGATFKCSTTLTQGSHNYYFYFDDGHSHTRRLPVSGTYSGPSVSSNQLAPAPTLVSPGWSLSPGSMEYTLTPTFRWNSVSGADQYGLYIRDMDTNTLIFDSQARGIIITGTSYTLLPEVLQWEGHYRWNMNSHNEAGWGQYCSPLYFYNIAYVSIPDSDGDGLPDTWESKYDELDPNNPNDASMDHDGDGLTNLQEYLLDSSGLCMYHPDLYVEIDYLDGYGPNAAALFYFKWYFMECVGTDAGINVHCEIDDKISWSQLEEIGVSPDSFTAAECRLIEQRFHNSPDTHIYVFYAKALSSPDGEPVGWARADFGAFINKEAVNSMEGASVLWLTDSYRAEKVVLLHEVGHLLNVIDYADGDEDYCNNMGCVMAGSDDKYDIIGMIADLVAYKTNNQGYCDHHKSQIDLRNKWSVDEYGQIVAVTGCLSLTVHSPVNVMIKDPYGRRVGYDPETGAVVNEIMGAAYSGPGSEPQRIVILNALAGTYDIEAFGTAEGTYTITVESVDPNDLIRDIETWQGNAVSGEQYIETTNLNDGGQLTSNWNEFLPADLNQDGTVSISDITIVARAFGSEPEDPNWNSIADLNKDNVVNILDIFAVAWDFGKTV